MCKKDKISPKELPHLGEIADIEALIDHVPETNEALKQIKKEIRQKAEMTVEKKFIMKALVKNDWNITKAARKEGLQRTNFQTLMKKHNIKLPKKHQIDLCL